MKWLAKWWGKTTWRDILFGGILIILTGTAFSWNQIGQKPYISPGDPGYATLDAILASSPAAGTNILVSTAQTLTASRILPAGVTLECLSGGVITIPSGVSFTCAGSVQAGPYQIFSGTGLVSLQANKDALLRWFGTAGNGTTDDTAAVQWAVTSILDNGPNNNSGTVKVAGSSSQGIRLCGTPGDVYLISGVHCYPAGSGSPSGNLILDLCGAKFLQKSVNLGVEAATASSNISTSNGQITFSNNHPFSEGDAVVMTCSGGHATEPQFTDNRYSTYTHGGHNGLFFVHVVNSNTIQLRYDPYTTAACAISSAGTDPNILLARSGDLIQYSYGAPFEICNAQLYGWSPSPKIYVSTALASAPSSISLVRSSAFGGSTITTTQVSSVNACTAEGDWYYNSLSGRLFIALYGTNYLPLTIYSTFTSSSPSHTFVNSDLTPYWQGKAVRAGYQGIVKIHNCSVYYMDTAFYYRCGYRCEDNNNIVSNCNCAVHEDYDSYATPSASKNNKHRNIESSEMWGPAGFYLDSSQVVELDQPEIDVFRGMFLYATNCQAITVKKPYTEGSAGGAQDWANGGGTPMPCVFGLNATSGFTLEDPRLYQGGSQVSAFTSYFGFTNGCSAMVLRGGVLNFMPNSSNSSNPYLSFYSNDGSCDILVIDGVSARTIDELNGRPSHVIVAGTTTCGTMVSASGLKYCPNYAYPETASTAHFNFTTMPSHTDYNGATLSQDTSNTYGSSADSAKLACSTANAGDSLVTSFFSAGPSTGLVTGQTIGINATAQTLTLSSGTWAGYGAQVGGTVCIGGCTTSSNNGTYVVASLSGAVLTWSGHGSGMTPYTESGNVSQSLCTTPWYPVTYGMIKADSASRFYIAGPCAGGTGQIPLAGDGNWRAFYLVGPPNYNISWAVMSPVSSYTFFHLYRTVGPAGGNLWITCVGQRWFATQAEANNWIGCIQGVQ